MARQGEKKGFIARMLEGKERDEEYARSTLPTNRWALFWDIFKGRFSKLVIVNLLIIVFCIPLVAVYFLLSFPTHRWDITWLIFLVAPAVWGILHAAASHK